MFTKLCNLACTIQRKTPTLEGGLQGETWQDLATVKCRLSGASSSSERDRAGVEGIVQTTRTLYLAPNTDILKGDRIVCEGQSYKVLSSEQVYGRGGVLYCECSVSCIQ